MKFRKKPVVIEAVQWTGENGYEIALLEKDLEVKRHCFEFFIDGTCQLSITTFEGVMKADIGDWVIKGVKGELYPCKPDIFALTYEEAKDDN